MMKLILGLSAFVVVRGSGLDKDWDFVIFGDGLSDVGNTFTITQGSYPSADYPYNSFSDELSWPEYFICPPSLRKNGGACPDSVNLRNYAFAGATTDSRQVRGFTGPWGSWPVPGVAEQSDMYGCAMAGEGRKTVFHINVGANDIYNSWANQKKPLTEELYREVAKRTVDLVAWLEDDGDLDGVIIVSTMYPITLTPLGNATVGQSYSNIAQEYNKVLLELLEPRIKRGKTHVFEFTQVVTDFINASGLKQAKCPFTVPRNCSEYLFVDGFYPAATLHRAIAKNMTDFTNNILKRNTQF